MRLCDFKIASRVWGCLCVLGALLILVCFCGYFSQNIVHNAYMRANAKIDTVRKLSLLENKLSELNGTVAAYVARNDSTSEQTMWDAFTAFETMLKENADSIADAEKENAEKFETAVRVYRERIEKIVSLSEKNIILFERIRRQGEDIQQKLSEMIAESTLPSATFALTNLQEQLQILTAESQKTGLSASDYADGIQTETDTLNKVMQSVRQAEMVNVKRLKGVTTALDAFQEETIRLIKAKGTLEEQEKEIASSAVSLRSLLKEIIEVLSTSSASVLFEAESDKLTAQKVFIFLAAFSGIVTLLTCWLALKGTGRPFNDLIDELLEFAHGKPKERVPYTDRNDEIGLLARSLSALLDAWKNPMLLSKRSDYLPLSAPGDDNASDGRKSDDFVYIGDDSVDAETQLRQMLLFLTNVYSSAKEMQNAVAAYVRNCDEQTALLQKQIQTVADMMRTLPSLDAETENVNVFNADLTRWQTSFAESSDRLMKLAEQQVKTAENGGQAAERIGTFAQELLQWIHVMTEIANSIHKTSLQTKILALNASIEVLKLGDRARPCNDIISEIRSLSQQTTAAVDKMMENMCALQNESQNLKEIADTLSGDVRNVYALAGETGTVATEIHQDSHNLAGKTAVSLNSVADTLSAFVPFVAAADNADAVANDIFPKIKEEADKISVVLNDFIAILPASENDETDLSV